MTVQAYLILTTQEKNDAEALNDISAAVEGQEVTNALANNLGEGTLVGKWVIPARIMNDPLYTRWLTMVASLPIRILDSETLFAPPPED